MSVILRHRPPLSLQALLSLASKLLAYDSNLCSRFSAHALVKKSQPANRRPDALLTNEMIAVASRRVCLKFGVSRKGGYTIAYNPIISASHLRCAGEENYVTFLKAREFRYSQPGGSLADCSRINLHGGPVGGWWYPPDVSVWLPGLGEWAAGSWS